MATSGRAAAPAGRPRRSYAKSEETRDVILDAALEVFGQSGYRRGSIKEVANRVGMSEPGLLHHFPSKSALLAAVLERRDQQSRELWHLDSVDGLVTVVGLIALAAHNASVPGVVELYCTLSAEATAPQHPAHGYFVDRYEQHRTHLTNAFVDLAARGALRADVDPASAARTTLALMDGLQVQWLLDRSSLDMAAELRLYLESLVTVPL